MKIHKILATVWVGTNVLWGLPPASWAADRVEQVAVPQALFVPKGSAVAYRVTGKPGALIRGVVLPLAPLLKQGAAADGRFVVYTLSNKRYRVIGARPKGRSLVADLIAGRTYVVARQPVGDLRTALRVLCKWKREADIRPTVDFPRICTQILCSRDRFSERRFYDSYGAPAGGGAPARLGGWSTPPGDLCARCTTPAAGAPDLGVPAFECLVDVNSPCGGRVLFQDDFEADTVGAPPSASPAGTPPDDRLNATNDAVIVTAGTKAVRITRGHRNPPTLDAVLGLGAARRGTYCVRFSGLTASSRNGAATVTLASSGGAVSWTLKVGASSVELRAASRQWTIPLDDPKRIHSYRFDMDLDIRTFDLFIDGNLAVAGAPIDRAFGSPRRLQFDLPGCTVECNSASWMADNIRVVKTN